MGKPQSGDTSDYSLIGLIYRSVARRYSTFKMFDNADVERMKGLLHELDPIVEYDAAVVLPIMEKYDMMLIVSKEEEDLVMIKPNNIRGFPVTFLWRFGKMWKPLEECPDDYIYPLIIESPHEGQDGATNIVAACTLNVRCRCVLFNGVHPDSGKGNRRTRADVAHAPTSLYSEFQKELTRMYPYLAVVQIHGMGGAPNFQCLVSDCHGSNWSERSIAREFCKGLAYNSSKGQKDIITVCCEIKDIINDKPVSSGPNKHFRSRTGCHNTTIQARILNGGGPSNVGTDTGRFVHVETGAIWRGDIGKKKRGARAGERLVSSAIEYAMRNWMKTDPGKFDDIDNIGDTEVIDGIEEECVKCSDIVEDDCDDCEECND